MKVYEMCECCGNIFSDFGAEYRVGVFVYREGRPRQGFAMVVSTEGEEGAAVESGGTEEVDVMKRIRFRNYLPRDAGLQKCSSVHPSFKGKAFVRGYVDRRPCSLC